MFFQGSDSIELLTASGKDPAAHWKTLGKVRREFDKASKAYLFVLDGPAAATKLSLPKDAKPLGLTHRYVVLQAWLPSGKAISLELGVTDVAGNRRRLLLSTAFRDCAVHQLHAQIPFQQLRRDTWMHWTFDVARLVASAFPSQALRTLDSIVLCGSWKLRRIFTMKDPPMSAAAAFASDDEHYVEIPRAFAVVGCAVETFSIPRIAAPAKPTATHRPETAPKSKKPAPAPRPHSSASSTKRPSAVLKSDVAKKPSLLKPPATKTEPTSSHVDRPSSSHVAFDPPRSQKTTPLASVYRPSPSIFDFASLHIPPLHTTPPSKPPATISKFASWEDDDDGDATEGSRGLAARMQAAVDEPLRVPEVVPPRHDTPLKSDQEDPAPFLDVAEETQNENNLRETSTTSTRALDCASKSTATWSAWELLEAASSRLGTLPAAFDVEDEEVPVGQPTSAPSVKAEAPETPEDAPETADKTAWSAQTVHNQDDGVEMDDDDDTSDVSFDLTDELPAAVAAEETSFDFDNELEDSLPVMVHKSASPVKTPPAPMLSSMEQLLSSARQDPRLKSLLGRANNIVFCLRNDPTRSHCAATDWSAPEPSSMDLLYDPVLHCYHDPATNKYYQLKY